MATVNISLLFDGNCEEAFRYYATVFHSEISSLIRYGDVPVQEGMPQLSENDKNKIENVLLPISKETFLMGADGVEAFGHRVICGTNFSVYISADSKDEADRMFNLLSGGGQISMPLTQSHWGDYFGMCKDKFGIGWMINYASPK